MAFLTTYSNDRRAFEQGRLSVSDRLEEFLQRIKNREALNAFVRIYASEARSRANEIDIKIRNRTHGKLAGLIVGLKDNIAWKGHELNAASRILENYQPTYSATVVERLLQEDAIILGHLNCDEFAMGSANELSKYGRTRNPYDESITTGGSSGGPAAAVSAGLCHVALGSDTGGSVRQPAAFCGVYGMKPTYGLVSRYGLVTYASTLDQIGPLANSTSDLQKVLDVVSGPDKKDHTLVADFPATGQENSGVIGYFKEVMDYPGLDTEIRMYFRYLLDILKEQGFQIRPLEFPYFNHLLPLYNILTTSEAATNLARYDGVRYGKRIEGKNWKESILNTRTKGFGPEVKRKIMMGNTVLLHNEKHRYYDDATKLRRKVKNFTDGLFGQVGFLISPTTPTVAHPSFAKKEVLERYKADVFTFHANLTGIPALNIPVFSHSGGLPFGIQISGNAFTDENLFDLAQQIRPLL